MCVCVVSVRVLCCFDFLPFVVSETVCFRTLSQRSNLSEFAASGFLLSISCLINVVNKPILGALTCFHLSQKTKYHMNFIWEETCIFFLMNLNSLLLLQLNIFSFYILSQECLWIFFSIWDPTSLEIGNSVRMHTNAFFNVTRSDELMSLFHDMWILNAFSWVKHLIFHKLWQIL